MSAINDYLRGERGEWLTVEAVARELTVLGTNTTQWPRMTYEEWLEAIEGAIASGEIECASRPRMVRYREPKAKKQTLTQGVLFND